MMGVYQIRNVVNDQAYVGSSCNLHNRLRFHHTSLKKNTHPNNYLQDAYNKYGDANFAVTVLEKVSDKTALLTREQYWTDLTLHEDGRLYNLNPFASSGIGHKVPEASKRAISENLKAQGIKPPSRAGVGYGFCKLYCPANHYKTSKALIHGSNSCKECQRLKSQKWRAEH